MRILTIYNNNLEVIEVTQIYYDKEIGEYEVY